MTLPMSIAWTDARSPLSAKNNMNTKMSAALKNSTIHKRRGDHADGAVDAVVAGLLPRRRLVEPLVVGRLLGRGLWLDRPQRPEQLDRPTG